MHCSEPHEEGDRSKHHADCNERSHAGNEVRDADEKQPSDEWNDRALPVMMGRWWKLFAIWANTTRSDIHHAVHSVNSTPSSTSRTTLSPATLAAPPTVATAASTSDRRDRQR